MDFDTFLKDFTKIDQMYLPKNPSLNHFRHFGIRSDNGILLNYSEVLYLFDRNVKNIKNPPLELKTYFELKNNDFNILQEGEEQLIYRKTKHFNRKKEDPYGELVYVEKDENILKYILDLNEDKKTVFAVKGKKDCCLVEVRSLTSLSKEITSKMHKSK